MVVMGLEKAPLGIGLNFSNLFPELHSRGVSSSKNEMVQPLIFCSGHELSHLRSTHVEPFNKTAPIFQKL